MASTQQCNAALRVAFLARPLSRPPTHCISRRREALARWQAYFHFKLVEHALTHRGQEEAAEALQQLGAGTGGTDQHPGGQAASPTHRSSAQLSALEQALVLFCRATLHLAAGEPTAASDVIGQVNPLIPPAAGSSDILQKQVSDLLGLVQACWGVGE